MMFTRFAVLVVASLMSGCFSLDLNLKLTSPALDMAAWSASPTGDVNGDGVDEILLQAGDTASDPTGTPVVWLLSGKDLSPIYSVAAENKREQQYLLAYAAASTADDVQVEKGDVVVLSFGLSKDDGAFPEQAYVIDPNANVRILTKPSGAAETDTKADDAKPAEEVPHAPGHPSWIEVGLIEPDASGWGHCSTQLYDSAGSPSLLLPPPAGIAQSHPELQFVEACGDIDGDGVLDWAGLTEKPRSVVLVSGADLRTLRTISMESQAFGTCATGMFEIGDVDQDGHPDWIVGIQVSQSDERESPRTCKLGSISLVSGADWHVIRSLERTSFLAGAGRSCPVVTVPAPVQP